MPKLTKQTLFMRFSPIFWKKHPFSCFRSSLSSLSRIHAYTRSSPKEHPIKRVFLFTHGYQSQTRVASHHPPPHHHPSLVLYSVINWYNTVSVLNYVVMITGKHSFPKLNAHFDALTLIRA